MDRVRDWKPGDVAMTAQGTVALCHAHGRMIDQDGAPWSDDRYPENLRPLVVIDPENRKEVARLLTGYYTFVRGTGEAIAPADDLVSPMQAALRELASPTPQTLLDRLRERAPDGLIDPALAEQVVKEWLADNAAEVTS